VDQSYSLDAYDNFHGIMARAVFAMGALPWMRGPAHDHATECLELSLKPASAASLNSIGSRSAGGCTIQDVLGDPGLCNRGSQGFGQSSDHLIHDTPQHGHSRVRIPNLFLTSFSPLIRLQLKMSSSRFGDTRRVNTPVPAASADP